MSNIIDNKPNKEVNLGKRRIPVGEYLKLKKNALRVYAELQRMSYRQPDGIEDHRYIPRWQITYASIAESLNLSINTVANKMKELKAAKLIKDINADSGIPYVILPNIGDYYVLVDLEDETVRDILENQDYVVFRTYLFHKSFHTYVTGKGEKNYTVTLEYIAETIGCSPTNLSKIIKANNWLRDRGVISITKTYNRDHKSLNMKENNTYSFIESDK